MCWVLQSEPRVSAFCLLKQWFQSEQDIYRVAEPLASTSNFIVSETMNYPFVHTLIAIFRARIAMIAGWRQSPTMETVTNRQVQFFITPILDIWVFHKEIGSK